MRVALFAYSSVGSRAYLSLRQLGAEIVAVFTHAESPGEVVWYEPAGKLARADGIPVHELPPANLPAPWPITPTVAALHPEIILSAYFRALLPAEILDLAPRGAYNLHGSLLPRYRGRAPVNWVLVHGENETGMTLHAMTPRADAGDIIGQIPLAIGPDETAPELQARLDDAAAALVTRWLPEIARGTAPRRPQDLSKGSYFGRRTPADGKFEWAWPAQRIHNLVRAVTRPFPGAFVEGPEGQITVWRTRIPPSAPEGLRPGEVHSGPGPSGGVLVGTGTVPIEVLDLTGPPLRPSAPPSTT